MKQDTAITLAKLQVQRDLLLAVLSNPVIELVGAFVLIESLQRFPSERPIIGNVQGNLLEGAIGGIIAVQQLAPSLPYIVQASEGMTKGIGSLAPALGALAMIPGLPPPP